MLIGFFGHWWRFKNEEIQNPEHENYLDARQSLMPLLFFDLSLTAFEGFIISLCYVVLNSDVQETLKRDFKFCKSWLFGEFKDDRKRRSSASSNNVSRNSIVSKQMHKDGNVKDKIAAVDVVTQVYYTLKVLAKLVWPLFFHFQISSNSKL